MICEREPQQKTEANPPGYGKEFIIHDIMELVHLYI